MKKLMAVLAVLALLVGVPTAADACVRRTVRIEHALTVCGYAPAPYVIVSFDAVHPVGQDATVTIETGGVVIATVTGHLDSPVHISAFVDPRTRVTLRVVAADGRSVDRTLTAPACRTTSLRHRGH